MSTLQKNARLPRWALMLSTAIASSFTSGALAEVPGGVGGGLPVVVAPTATNGLTDATVQFSGTNAFDSQFVTVSVLDPGPTAGSASSIIDWASFNVSNNTNAIAFRSDNTVIPIAVLNRVSGIASSINGAINAQSNFQIWIVNGAGIFMGPDASFNGGGLVLSTAGFVNDAAFTNGFNGGNGGAFVLNGAPAGSSIIVQGGGTGTINAPLGFIAVAQQIDVSKTVNGGQVVALVAAQDVTLNYSRGNPILGITITAGTALGSYLNSSGVLSGGEVKLVAASQIDSIASLLNVNGGSLTATTAGGRVVLATASDAFSSVTIGGNGTGVGDGITVSTNVGVGNNSLAGGVARLVSRGNLVQQSNISMSGSVFADAASIAGNGRYASATSGVTLIGANGLAIDQVNATAGSIDVRSGTGALTANALFGQQDVSASGASVSIGTGAVAFNGALSVNAGVGDALLVAGSGNTGVQITSAAGSVSAGLGGNSISSALGNVTLSAAQALGANVGAVGNDLTATGNTVSLRADQTVTRDIAIGATSTVQINGGGSLAAGRNIDVNTGGTFTSAGSTRVNLSGQNLFVRAGQGTLVGNLLATGSTSIGSSAGDIDVSGTVSGASADLIAGGALRVVAPSLNAGTLSGNSISVTTSAGQLLVGNSITATNNITLTGGGAGGVRVIGSTVSTAGAVTIDAGTGAVATGAVEAARAVNIDGGAIVAGQIGATDLVRVRGTTVSVGRANTSAGATTLTATAGDLTVTGAALSTAGTTLSATGGNLSTGSAEAAIGNVSLTATGAVRSGGGSAGGDLVIQGNSVAIGGLQYAGGAISVSSATTVGAAGASGASLAGGGLVSVTGPGGIALTSANSRNGDVSINSTGGAVSGIGGTMANVSSNNGAVTVRGTTALLDRATAGTSLTILTSGDASIGTGIAGTGALVQSTGGAVSISSVLGAGGTAQVQAGTSATIATIQSNTGAVSVTGATGVSVATAVALTGPLALSTTNGNLTLGSGRGTVTDITKTGASGVVTIGSLTTTGPTRVASSTNATIGNIAASGATSDVTVTASGNVALGTVSSTRNVSVTGTSVDATGAVTGTNGNASVTALGGNATVASISGGTSALVQSNTANASAGVITSATGTTTVRANNGVASAGAGSQAGTDYLVTGQSVLLTGTQTALGNLTATATAGSITATGALSTGAVMNLTASNGIRMTSGSTTAQTGGIGINGGTGAVVGTTLSSAFAATGADVRGASVTFDDIVMPLAANVTATNGNVLVRNQLRGIVVSAISNTNDVNVGSFSSSFGATLRAVNGTVTTGGGTGGGPIDITARTVSITGPVTASAGTLNAAATAGTLTSIGALSSTGAMTLSGTTGLSLTSATSTGGTLSATATNGTLLATGTLASQQAMTVAGSAGVTLLDGARSAAGMTIGSSGGNILLAGGATLPLPGFSAATALTISSPTGSVSASAPLSATNSVSVSGATGLTLGEVTSSGGTVSLTTTGGALTAGTVLSNLGTTISKTGATGEVIVGALTSGTGSAGDATINSSTNILIGSATARNGALTLNAANGGVAGLAGGRATLAATGATGDILINSPPAAAPGAASSALLGNVNAARDLTVLAGTIDVTAAVAGRAIGLTSTGRTTVGSAGAGTTLNVSAAAVDAGALTAAGGTLNVAATNGTLSTTGLVFSTGGTTLSGSTGVTMTGGAISGGAISVSSSAGNITSSGATGLSANGGAIGVTAANGLIDLNASRASTGISYTARGITLSGAQTAAGGTFGATATAGTLVASGLLTSSGAMTLAGSNGVALTGGATSSNALSITSTVGGITTSGATGLSANGGALTMTAAGTIAASATGGDATSSSGGTTMTAAAITLGGRQASGSGFAANAVAGALASTGPIVVTGAVDLRATGALTTADVTSTAGSLTVNGGDQITMATLSSGTGTTINKTGTTGEIAVTALIAGTAGAGTTTITSATNIRVGSATATGGTLTLVARNGAITGLAGGRANLSATGATSDVLVNDGAPAPAGTSSVLLGTVSAGRNVAITAGSIDTGAITATAGTVGLTTPGTLSIGNTASNGNLTISAASVNAAGLSSATGTLGVTATTGTLAATGLLQSGGAMTLAGNTGVALSGGATSSGALSVTSAAGGISSTGATGLTANGGALTLAAANGTIASNATSASSTTSMTARIITLTGTQTTSATTGGTFTASATAGDFRSAAAISARGAVDLRATADLRIADVTSTTGALTLISGGQLTAGIARAGTAATLTKTGTTGEIEVTALTAGTSGAGTATIDSATNIRIGSATATGGTLTLVARNGAITGLAGGRANLLATGAASDVLVNDGLPAPTAASSVLLGTVSAGRNVRIAAAAVDTLAIAAPTGTVAISSSSIQLGGAVTGTSISLTNAGTAATAIGGTTGTGYALSETEVNFLRSANVEIQSGANAMNLGTLALAPDVGSTNLRFLSVGNVTVTGAVTQQAGAAPARTFQLGGTAVALSPTGGLPPLARSIEGTALPTGGAGSGAILLPNAIVDLRADRIAFGQARFIAGTSASANPAAIANDFVSNAGSALYSANNEVSRGVRDTPYSGTVQLLSASLLRVSYGQYALFQNTSPFSLNSSSVVQAGVVLGTPTLNTGTLALQIFSSGDGPTSNAFALFGTINGFTQRQAAPLGQAVIEFTPAGGTFRFRLSTNQSRVNGCLIGQSEACLVTSSVQPAIRLFDERQAQVFGSTDNSNIPFDPLVGTNNEALIGDIASGLVTPENCDTDETGACRPEGEK